ncbi:hypothetical protein VQ042_11380 [Aurantimonas sp. A2-1-M11]|uniref:hypothetical protein n=1 Tax=Aurantimonas sp. A2-1-M11 TaxID=3113712 RepID=UPI002F946139
MAAPTDPDFLNQFGVYIGGFLAAVITGIVAKLSLKRGKAASETETYTQVAGALVDSSSVRDLAASIEAINLTLLTIHRDSETVGKARVETLKAMVAAVEALSANVNRTNVLTEREEEDRERREREKTERERDAYKHRTEELEAELRKRGGRD